MFVILADDVPVDLVTIASRCVRVDFHALPEPLIADTLEQEGAAHDTALASARAAAGNLDRARLLADDPAVGTRTDAFAGLPRRLDGTGHAVCLAVDELLGLIDAAATPLKERQSREAADLQHQMDELGERGSSQKRLEERHRRELRRHRIDELKVGLAASAATYRDALVEGRAHQPAAAVGAVQRHPPGHRGPRAQPQRAPAAPGPPAPACPRSDQARLTSPGVPVLVSVFRSPVWNRLTRTGASSGGGAGGRPLQLHGHSPR